MSAFLKNPKVLASVNAALATLELGVFVADPAQWWLVLAGLWFVFMAALCVHLDGDQSRASDPVPPGFGVGPGESPSRRGRPNEDD